MAVSRVSDRCGQTKWHSVCSAEGRVEWSLYPVAERNLRIQKRLFLGTAALVILFGAAWVLAEETMKIEVRSEGGKAMTIDVNGVTEIVTLDKRGWAHRDSSSQPPVVS